MTYERWLKRYHNKKVIKLKKELEDEYIDILKRLNLIVKNDKYTGYEFEKLMIDVGSYYKDDDMTEIELEYYKPLEETDLSQEEYKKLNNKIDTIFNKYEYIFKM